MGGQTAKVDAVTAASTPEVAPDDKAGQARAYSREYYFKHREEITNERRQHYNSDSRFREQIKSRVMERYKATQGEKKKVMRELGQESPVRGYNRPRVMQLGGKDILVHSVKEFADKVGRNVQTITAWEEGKVIPPPTVVDEMGRRWYSESHIERISDLSKAFRTNGGRSLSEFKGFIQTKLKKG